MNLKIRTAKLRIRQGEKVQRDKQTGPLKCFKKLTIQIRGDIIRVKILKKDTYGSGVW